MKNYNPLEGFTCSFYNINDFGKTAFFVKKSINNYSKNKTILLVHGFNGSSYGLSFIADELMKYFNLILVDMPGHGLSDIPKSSSDLNLNDLRVWFDNVIKISQKIFDDDTLNIVTHSFSCCIISPEVSQRFKTIFICPVPKIFKLNKAGSFLVSKMFIFNWMIDLYNWIPFYYFRGLVLIKNKSKLNRQRILSIAKSESNFSNNLRKFQFDLFVNVYNEDFFSKTDPSLVITGKYDILNYKKNSSYFKLFFPKSYILELDTNHIPTIEKPEEIVRLINAQIHGKIEMK